MTEGSFGAQRLVMGNDDRSGIGLNFSSHENLVVKRDMWRRQRSRPVHLG
jgi:hypothetical protein